MLLGKIKTWKIGHPISLAAFIYLKQGLEAAFPSI